MNISTSFSRGSSKCMQLQKLVLAIKLLCLQILENIMPYHQVMKSPGQKLKIRIQMIRNDVYLTITIKSNSLYI